MKPKRNSSVNTSVWGIKNRPPTRQMQAQIRRLRRAGRKTVFFFGGFMPETRAFRISLHIYTAACLSLTPRFSGV